MQTLMVTGGAGFIGSNFILTLLREDREIRVINYDVLTYAGNLENLVSVLTGNVAFKKPGRQGRHVFPGKARRLDELVVQL